MTRSLTASTRFHALSTVQLNKDTFNLLTIECEVRRELHTPPGAARCGGDHEDELPRGASPFSGRRYLWPGCDQLIPPFLGTWDAGFPNKMKAGFTLAAMATVIKLTSECMSVKTKDCFSKE